MTQDNLCDKPIHFLPAHNEYYLRFIQGDEQVLAKLYPLFYKKLLRSGLRMTDDVFTVETAIQDAFVRCWRMREQMKSLGHIYFFLRQQMRWNCCTQWRRRDVMRRYVALEAQDDEWLADPDSLESTMHARANAAEKVRLIDAVIPCLPMNRQTVLKLYFRYGFSYKYIAKRLAMTHAAAYREVADALQVLKKIIHSQQKLSREAFAAKPLVLPELDKHEHTMLLVKRWRSVYQLSFAEIGERLHTDVGEVKRLYVEAMRGGES